MVLLTIQSPKYCIMTAPLLGKYTAIQNNDFCSQWELLVMRFELIQRITVAGTCSSEETLCVRFTFPDKTYTAKPEKSGHLCTTHEPRDWRDAKVDPTRAEMFEMRSIKTASPHINPRRSFREGHGLKSQGRHLTLGCVDATRTDIHTSDGGRLPSKAQIVSDKRAVIVWHLCFKLEWSLRSFKLKQSERCCFQDDTSRIMFFNSHIHFFHCRVFECWCLRCLFFTWKEEVVCLWLWPMSWHLKVTCLIHFHSKLVKQAKHFFFIFLTAHYTHVTHFWGDIILPPRKCVRSVCVLALILTSTQQQHRKIYSM